MFKILLVDDNEITQAIEKLMLESCGLSVETASSGLEAVRLAEKKHYFLIFMDIQMRDMDGFQATELIREKNIDTPVIALSADEIAHDDPNFLRSKMNGSLIKPISKTALTALIQRYTDTFSAVNRSKSTDDIIFDDNALLKVIKNRSAVQRILSQFLDTHSNDCIQLKTFAENGEFLHAREILHNIIGISGNLFCHRLHRISCALSADLKNELTDNLEEFINTWNITYQAIADYRGKMLGETTETVPNVDWQLLWKDFILLCSEFDIAAADLFSKNIRVFMANMESDSFEQLKQAVFSYDFIWIIENMGKRHV